MKEGDRRPSVIRKTDNAEYTNELLVQFLIDNDCTNIDTALLEEMKNKANVLKEHPYKISEQEKHGETYYITYVKDETKRNKRRQISAKTKANLENKIYEAYKAENTLTFGKYSKEWLKYYKTTVKETTFSRTMNTYNKFMPSCSLANKDIRKIKMLDVKKYLQDTIIKEELLEQAYKNLKSLLNGIFTYALEQEIINKNPMDGMKVSLAHIKQKEQKEQTELVFIDSEKELLRNTIKADIVNFKNTVAFAILLAFQLGLRVSELVALKWSDISNGYIHIQREEIVYDKYDDDCNLICSSYHEIIERTKTDMGNRILMLTPEAIRILEQVKEWNISHNIHSEFIFADKNGKNFNRQRINKRLYSYCTKIGIIKKSSHKIRSTVISNLLDTIVNKKAVQDFAGHKHIETTLGYYRNTSSEQELYRGMCACL